MTKVGELKGKVEEEEKGFLFLFFSSADNDDVVIVLVVTVIDVDSGKYYRGMYQSIMLF